MAHTVANFLCHRSVDTLTVLSRVGATQSREYVLNKLTNWMISLKFYLKFYVDDTNAAELIPQLRLHHIS